MYKPLFNQVLVELEIDRWGKGSDDNLGGEVYREGKIIEFGDFLATRDYPHIQEVVDIISTLGGTTVMWNEGHEAGKVFDHEDKKYAFVYWWDLVGVKDGE